MSLVFPVGLKKPAGTKEAAQGFMNSTLTDHDDHNLHILYRDYDDHNLYHRAHDDQDFYIRAQED